MKRKRSEAATQEIDSEDKNKKKLHNALDQLKKAAATTEPNNFKQLLLVYKQSKHPILQTLEQQPEVYKPNPEKKKKPIELYLDTINSLYKKKDLDLLISPLAVQSVWEKWAPREIAIFELAIVRFGKQFEFISELIETKSTKDVFEFYLQWKNTTHYKSYKTNKANANRSNLQSIV